MKNILKAFFAVGAGVTLLGSVNGWALERKEAPVVSGCHPTDYVDGGVHASINTSGTTYSPKCLRVKIGSTVEIAGSSRHPLQGQADVGGVANPYRQPGHGATSPQSRTLNTAGFYGFYCENHGEPNGQGMAGSIQVVKELSNSGH